MSNNCFLVRFTSEVDYTNATFGGPWKIYDYYIAVSHWSPSFNEEEPVKSILTWVRLPKLPIQYFNSLAVHRIGNYIGKTVKLDLATSEGARCRYARICVEVDVTKPLLGKFMIEVRVFKIEYESLENVCFDCGCYGHKKESCPVEIITAGAKVDEAKNMEPELSIEEQDIGEWMTVQRRNHKKSVKGSSSSAQLKGDGSRFSPLLQVDPVQVAAPVQVAVPVQAVASNSTTEASIVTEVEAQVAKLKKVLDDALVNQSLAGQENANDQTKQMKISREPLKDISNVTASSQKIHSQAAGKNSSGQVVVNLESDEGLIPVTVVYQNPTFQSKLPESRPLKPKAKTAHRTTGANSKDPNPISALLGNKKRSFKKKVSGPGKSSTGSDQNVNVGNLGVDTRKPSDRS
ncbi:hypothetical protein LINPERHAP2_LOCUS4897 [Linum perenne]